MTTRAALISAAAILATIVVRGAQQPSAKWIELQRHDLTDIGREGVEMSIEIPPGVTTARHSHAGDDFGYVIEGTIVLQVDGNPPLTVKAGETFFTPRGRIHNARNIGKTTARAVDTYIIDQGKPVVISEGASAR
ncbi:MAG: cupin domain-containing protein [Bryobacteraceae bacterium]